MKKIEFDIILKEIGLLNPYNVVSYNELGTIYLWNNLTIIFKDNNVYVSGDIPTKAFSLIYRDSSKDEFVDKYKNYHLKEYVNVNKYLIDSKDDFIKFLLEIKDINCMYQSQVFDYESMIGEVNLSMIKACGCNKDMYECIGIEKDELEVILNKNDSKLFSSTMISDMRNTVNKFVQAVNPFSLKEVTSDDLKDYTVKANKGIGTSVKIRKNDNPNNYVMFNNSEGSVSYGVKYDIEDEKSVFMSYNFDIENLCEYIYIGYYKDNILVDSVNYCLTTNKVDNEKVDFKLLEYLCYELKKASYIADRMFEFKEKDKKIIKK